MSEQQAQQPEQPFFSIEKIYVKDLSLEVPNAPHIFLQQETPEVGINVHSQGAALDQESIFHVVVTVTLTAKVGDKTMFLVEAAMAGIFQIRNIPLNEMEPVLGITCPNILFPYVREVISDAVMRAGFQPVYLAPINFEAVFAHKKQLAQQQEGAAVTH